MYLLHEEEHEFVEREELVRALAEETARLLLELGLAGADEELAQQLEELLVEALLRKSVNAPAAVAVKSKC